MNKNAIMWIAAGVGAYLAVQWLRKNGGVSGLAAAPKKDELPADWWTGDYTDAQKSRFRRIWLQKQNVETEKVDPETGQKLYAHIAYRGSIGPVIHWTKYPPGTVDPGFHPPMKPRVPMTPEELAKSKDAITKSYDEIKKRYQDMIDAGRNYHGMTPAQLKRWIADIPNKIREKVRELERHPKPVQKATPVDSIDFSIDKKPGQEPPSRSWDPYKPMVPATTPEPTEPTLEPTPPSQASPAVPSVRPAISPAFMLKATTTRAAAVKPTKALRGLGCIGLDCF